MLFNNLLYFGIRKTSFGNNRVFRDNSRRKLASEIKTPTVMNNKLKSLLYLASFVAAIVIYDNSNKNQETEHAVADVTIEQTSTHEGLN